MTTVAADAVCAPAASHAMDAEPAALLAGVFKALADPLRLRMLSAVATDPRGESCVCDLAALADVSQPTISHHLKVLKDAGLLEAERRGTWVWYRVRAERRAAVTRLLDVFAPSAVTEGEMVTAPVGPEIVDLDDRVTRLADALAEQHADIPRQAVVGLVRESFTSLARSSRVTQHLISLTERFAQQRLEDLVRSRDSGPPQVLFVCAANAGRSQLAAALTHQLSEGRVVARSAGSVPAADVYPGVRAVLAELDAGGEHAFPKPLTDDAVRAADVVVRMGCGDVCPIVPGVRYEDWAVADPALAAAEGVEAIRDDIAARVRTLIASLGE